MRKFHERDYGQGGEVVVSESKNVCRGISQLYTKILREGKMVLLGEFTNNNSPVIIIKFWTYNFFYYTFSCLFRQKNYRRENKRPI